MPNHCSYLNSIPSPDQGNNSLFSGPIRGAHRGAALVVDQRSLSGAADISLTNDSPLKSIIGPRLSRQ